MGNEELEGIEKNGSQRGKKGSLISGKRKSECLLSNLRPIVKEK